MRPRAFTLIELIVVCVVMGLLAAVSIPKFKKAYSSLEMMRFCRQLQSSFDYLTQVAVMEKEVVKLTFDIHGRRYEAVKAWDEEADQKILLSQAIPAGFEFEADTQMPEIRFYPDASVDSVTITVRAALGRTAVITTEGVYSGVRVSFQN